MARAMTEGGIVHAFRTNLAAIDMLLKRRVWVASAVFLLAGCGPPPAPHDSGVLHVLTRTSATTYYLGPDQRPTGFEYDLTSRFAESQGWEFKIKPVASLSRLLERVESGSAHLGAAGLAITPEREALFHFGPAYAEEQEVVVCGPAVTPPASLAELVGMRLEVVEGSSHLEALRTARTSLPALRWEEVRVGSEEELLERASNGLSDCVVADSVSFDIAWNFLPSLRVAFNLGAPRKIAWALPKTADPRLLDALARFFKSMRASGELEGYRERYFGHVRRLDEIDVQGLLERRIRLLPGLRAHFEQAQSLTGLDWRLLAALAYQESQWDAGAVSPTGVRGIMMLTEQTADHLGIKNRLDVEESILGGARYVLQLRDSLAFEIPEPDRTWMALAAYNIGLGHFEDARRLTARLGKNPNAWRDVKEVLPLIAKAKYAHTLKYGFARGGEARALAENVRIYYDILVRYEPAQVFEFGFGN
jgi:membrane-bound lytic murein transglycosylase F